MKNTLYSICLLCIIFVLQNCNQSKPAASTNVGDISLTNDDLEQKKIRIDKVSMHLIDTLLKTNGSVVYNESYVSHVYSPVTGRVSKLFAELGKKVKKGDPLAEIISPDIGIASADLDKAKASFVQQEANYLRQKKLFSAGALAQHDFESVEDSYKQAKAEYARSQKKVQLLQGSHNTHITQHYILRALIDGEVVDRQINIGTEIQGQYSGGTTNELFTIADLNHLWIVSDIYEADLSRVAIGQRVYITLAASPNTMISGNIDWISDTLDPSLHTGKIRCTVCNTSQQLKNHMLVDVAIETHGISKLTIPRQSIMHVGDKTVVFVRQAQQQNTTTFRMRPVIVDEDTEGPNIPVIQGLQADELIVMQNADLLFEMMQT